MIKTAICKLKCLKQCFRHFNLLFFRERNVCSSGIEHHQIDRFMPPVFTVMERINQLHDAASCGKSLRESIFSNDRQLALQYNSGIDNRMTVHRQPFADTDRHSQNRHAGFTRGIRRQSLSVPAYGCIDNRHGTLSQATGIGLKTPARFPGCIRAHFCRRFSGHYFRFFLRITSSISSVMRDRSHSGFQPHSSRAQVSSSELGQLSAMAFFTGSTL